MLHRANRAEINVVWKAQRHGLARLLHGEAHRRLQLRADHRHGLGPAAILAARLESGCLELLDQIGDRLLLANAAHRPPLEFVRGQHPGDLRHALDADRGWRDLRKPNVGTDGHRQRRSHGPRFPKPHRKLPSATLNG